MADAAATTNANANTGNEGAGVAPNKWTEGEKSLFMMKIIEQLTSGSAKVKLSELNMPGRTTKSLSHMLGKIKDEAGVVRGGDRSTAGAAPKGKGPAKKATGAGRKRVKKAESEDDNEDTAPPSKKKARRNVKKEADEPQNPKIEASAESEDEFASVISITSSA